jgi:hypothetical protein
VSYVDRRKRRARKYDEQDGACFYCDGEMLLVHLVEGSQPPALATLEHIKQRAKGGTYECENTKAACAACNTFRPDGMTSEDYRALRQRLIVVWPACTHPTRPIRRLLAQHARINQGIAA